MAAPTPGDPDTIQRLDELIAQCRELTNAVGEAVPARSSSNVSIGGGGFWSGLTVGMCIATCLATWIALVLFGMEIHDLRAWREIDHGKITKLEAKQ